MAKEGEKELVMEMARQLRATEGKERQKGIMKPEKPNRCSIASLAGSAVSRLW